LKVFLEIADTTFSENKTMNGLNEIQAVELIMLVLTTGMFTGAFLGVLVRAMKIIFYE